jgi:hydrogenase expression/formation protein HypE
VGVEVTEEAITVQSETFQICSHFQIDPLQLIGSGALLISADAKSANAIVRNLRNERVQASVIGEFTKNVSHRVLMQKDRETKDLPRPLSDHLWIALRR